MDYFTLSAKNGAFLFKENHIIFSSMPELSHQ